MAATPTHCSRCGGSIEEGFIPDYNHHTSYSGVSTWFSGTPEKSIWFGLKLKGCRRAPVIAYRCGSCGHLELYARQTS